ncbi:hypothetical protein [Microscilla marina]|uniref:Lipoprotein, putative n=1 Tax=Microscilla marina ATCC 23134 TaxID=313606 RepID=A1ZN22_MICM2|nr:hypothetical protein [Microscilla marina]EAY28203.1 lipoprotein, putative [Microscilla marina ATCC 23134]
MTKSLTKLFSLIAVASVVFFSSCKKSEDATVTAPTATLADASTATNPSYEKGDKITYKLTAALPGGYKAGSGKKTVGGVDAPFTLSGINAGDTAVSATFTVDVTEDAGQEVTVSVTLIDNSDQNVTAEAKYTVAAVGQGGGGAAPLLSGTATVSLGAETATFGSYLATSKAGVFKSSEAQANQADIDITFGVGNTGGPSLISPDARVSSGLNAGNPAMTATRTTFFKAESSGPSDLGAVTALNVENNITKSTSKSVQIAVGSVYSFVQDGATGKKGYIKVDEISGTGTARVAKITFVVQK